MAPGAENRKESCPRRIAQRWLGRPRPVKATRSGGVLLALVLVLGGCEDDGMTPSNLRFGQLGEIRVQVRAPLALGKGELQQSLTWNSNGAWRIRESVSYNDLPGDEDLRRSPGDPGAFASAYASLITQVNETQGLKLFIESLSPDLDPECEPLLSTVTFRILDEARGEDVSWTRCATGSLVNLSPSGAGPDPDASRVIVAATLARDFTVGREFNSVYTGTIPFGTLDRGDDPGAALAGPQGFRSDDPTSGSPPGGWLQFWNALSGGAPPPDVDWTREMVMVAAVGERFEAGDSVEVRRIVTVGSGAGTSTVMEYVERVPGDFCSPAARSVRPFHVVVAPRTPGTIRFAELATERVPCGF